MRKLFLFSIALSLFCSCCSDDTDVFLSERYATSIFVGSDRHESGHGNNLTGVLSAVVNDHDIVIPSMVLLGGDYVGGGGGANPAFPISDLDQEVDSAMAGHPYKRLYTYGSHDINCYDGYGAFFSGPYAADGYYIYGISYAQMIYDTPDTTYTGIDKVDIHGSSALEATKFFDGWVSGITDHKPIILMSHVPIHKERNDNMGGERWYQSISKAAENHDILLLFCHNHTVEESGDSVSERQKYMLVPGDSVTTQSIIVKSGRTIVSNQTYGHKLNFYYGNAGYLKHGYGSLLTFRRSEQFGKYETLTIKRYSIIDPTPAILGYTDKPNPYTITLTK